MTIRRLPLAFLLLLLVSARAAGQSAEGSTISDVLARITANVNDFRYDSAVKTGEDARAMVRTMRPSQLIAYRTIMAAAYFPEDSAAQRPESALQQLDDLVRLRPDATIPAELRWTGLDSLLAISKARVFSVAVRPAAQHALLGKDGRAFIDVVASRPTRFRLQFASLTTGAVVAHDSTQALWIARLGFRAHDGTVPLLEAGPYEMRVTAVDVLTGDSLTFTRVARVDGTPPVMEPRPVFDSAKVLLPEMERPKRTGMVVRGVIFSVATYAIATFARAEEPIKSAYATDDRALVVSVATLAAATAAIFLDKGRRLPENAVANAAARAQYVTQVMQVEKTNERRIAEYRAVVNIEPEERP